MKINLIRPNGTIFNSDVPQDGQGYLVGGYFSKNSDEMIGQNIPTYGNDNIEYCHPYLSQKGVDECYGLVRKFHRILFEKALEENKILDNE